MAGRYLFPSCQRSLLVDWARVECRGLQRARRVNSRLHGLGEGVQKVLDLVGLFPQLVERAGVVCGAVAASSIAEGALVAQVVAGGAANLGHGV